MRLHPFAICLYAYIKRVAGDNGVCFQSTRTISKKSNMSMGTVSKYKKVLVEMGLIKITEKGESKFGKRNHNISIVNIWKENARTFLERNNKSKKVQVNLIKNQYPSSGEAYRSPGEHDYLLDERYRSPGEIKNNLIKNKSNKKNYMEEEITRDLYIEKKVFNKNKRDQAINFLNNIIME
jgi:hypothetical protein